MIDKKRFKESLQSVNNDNFDTNALSVFEYQWHHNSVYQHYCNLLNRDPENVEKLEDIPFLPIEFFKKHIIKTGDWATMTVFKSSGTTGTRSTHHVQDEPFYHRITQTIYESHFHPLKDVQVLALLPSYIEQGDSSLISMVNYFISQSAEGGGFFLDDDTALRNTLKSNPKKVLFGVSYALLDFIENSGIETKNTTIIETGGMKGRKKELTREELHKRIKRGFGVGDVYSEYGMTELLSQAYGKNGEFSFPPWAKILIRDINDPFSFVKTGKTGGINIIDLAHIDTISFIETKDLGKINENGDFEVLGRFDNTDLRGCNLLIQ